MRFYIAASALSLALECAVVVENLHSGICERVLSCVHSCARCLYLSRRNPSKTHRKQALIFSGKTPNVSTASCASAAPANTSLSVVTTASWYTWQHMAEEGSASSSERSHWNEHLKEFYGKSAPALQMKNSHFPQTLSAWFVEASLFLLFCFVAFLFFFFFF